MPDVPSDQGQQALAPKQISFHYLKSSSFRTIHVDGAHGGVTPRGDAIHLSLFSERFPIPVQVTNELEHGQVGNELSRVSREGIVREVEVSAIMSIETAEKVANWLLNKVEDARKLQGDKPE